MSVQLTRWQRYGKDRLYVKSAGGTQLGYRDLLTGQDHPASAAWDEAVISALAGWNPDKPGPVEAVDDADGRVEATCAPTDVHTDDVDADEAAWEDLSQRRAGAMAREQAVALKEAAPVRTFVARVLGVHTDERAWRIGADGEEMVAGQLAKLVRKDPRWQYLHAIPVGENGADIDHIVIGPGGVLTLNAKHHPGGKIWVRGDTLMINGHRQPYIRNSRHEARRAGRLLTTACGFPVEAVGVVVPVGAESLTVKVPPDDVHVVSRMRLARWLRQQPPTVPVEQVEAIFAAARRSTTWR